MRYSHAYKTRLKIHKISSFAMLPLFGTELVLGQSLYDGNGGESKKGAHAAVGVAIGALFGVNTVTGVWNLWEGRKDPHGRTRRILHSVLMLAADAGFTITAALAPESEHGNIQDRRSAHRTCSDRVGGPRHGWLSSDVVRTVAVSSTFSSTLQWWVGVYASHAVLRTVVAFAHIGGLVGGGGCAIAADYATLALSPGAAMARAAHVQSIRRTHAIVVAGLILTFVSGLLLLGADLETYLGSRVFWLKMALIAALLVNGVVLMRLERPAVADGPGWDRLRRASIVSIALWLLTTLLGAALPNIG